MVSRLIGCDVHRIEAADPYPEDYDPTVRRNVEEQNTDARPGIANPLTVIDRYDTVLLGSPMAKVAASTVWEILKDAGVEPAPERTSVRGRRFCVPRRRASSPRTSSRRPR
jgi:hypothetical protein